MAASEVRKKTVEDVDCPPVAPRPLILKPLISRHEQIHLHLDWSCLCLVRSLHTHLPPTFKDHSRPQSP